MKTLTAAALLAALTCTGPARAAEPARTPEANPAKKAEPGKLTVESLGAMLEAMGYDGKPAKNKEGLVCGYDIVIEGYAYPIYCTLEVSKNGQVVWLYGTLARTADAKTPAPVLLAVLRANLTVSPASINYSPNTKKFEVLLTLSNEGLTPAKLRTALNQFARGVKEALTAIDKATAIEKEKAEGEKS